MAKYNVGTSVINPVATKLSGSMAKKSSSKKSNLSEAEQVEGLFRGGGIAEGVSKALSGSAKLKTSSPIERRLQAKSAPLVGAPAAPKPAVASARVREEFNARVDPRFATLRERATAASNSATQGDVEAIKRRFAASGSLNSGEAMKIEQQAREKGAELGNLAQQDINTAEIGDIAQQRAAFDERQFAREQTDVANQFASGEAKKAMKFQKQMAEKEMGFKNKMASQEAKQFKQNLDLAKKQLKLDKKVTEFNMKMARDAANQKGLMDRLGGAFGSAGGGISNFGKGLYGPQAMIGNAVGGPLGGLGGSYGGNSVSGTVSKVTGGFR